MIFDYKNLKICRICLELDLLSVDQLDQLSMSLIENYDDFDLYHYIGDPYVNKNDYLNELLIFVSHKVKLPDNKQQWRRYLIAHYLDHNVDSLNDVRNFFGFLINQIDGDFSDEQGIYSYYDISALAYVETLYDDWIINEGEEEQLFRLLEELKLQKKIYLSKYLNIL